MKKTLIMGASPNPSRYAYLAAQLLQEYGHPIVAFGKQSGTIGHQPITGEFPEHETFDTVTLYLNPVHQETFIQPILMLKPKRVIFNPGTENPAFEQLLRQSGIEPIEACTLVMLRTGQY